MTNEAGMVYKNVQSDFESNYTKNDYAPVGPSNEVLESLKKKIENAPKDFKNYYLLNKIFVRYGLAEEGEQYFRKIVNSEGNSFYFQYLLAKCYEANGKGELAEELISNQKAEKTPVMAWIISKLKEIDQEREEEEYLAALKSILKISPLITIYFNKFPLNPFLKKKIGSPFIQMKNLLFYYMVWRL